MHVQRTILISIFKNPKGPVKLYQSNRISILILTEMVIAIALIGLVKTIETIFCVHFFLHQNIVATAVSIRYEP